MNKCFILIFITFSVLTAWDYSYRDRYEIVPLCEGSRPKVGTSSQRVGDHNAVNGLIMQIYIKDSLLFVASYGDGIEVFNLANPSLPVKISQINIPARDFRIKDTFLYSVAEDSLRIINIADIFNPYQVGAGIVFIFLCCINYEKNLSLFPILLRLIF